MSPRQAAREVLEKIVGNTTGSSHSTLMLSSDLAVDAMNAYLSEVMDRIDQSIADARDILKAQGSMCSDNRFAAAVEIAEEIRLLVRALAEQEVGDE